MIWHLLAHWLSFFFPVFYKKIEGKNIHYLKTKGPAIIAMNHPNAFTDPIIITHLTYPLRLKYMARGDAFKPGLATFLLESMGIVPIFRLRDGGKEGLKKNDDSYRRVNALLAENKKLIVFAEGLCIQERRLRPLKKGVARMVFGAYEALQNDALTIIPVGINYSQPDAFRSAVFYNVGEPIPVKDYLIAYQQNQARAQNLLLSDLSSKMKELVTHIEKPEDDEAMLQVETLCLQTDLKQNRLKPTLENQLRVLQSLTEKVNSVSEKQPDLFKTFKHLSNDYFNELKKHGLRDWLIRPGQKISSAQVLFRSLLLLIGLPIYVFAWVINYPAMAITHAITQKTIKSVEFYSSVAIGVSMLVFTLFYSFWFVLVGQLCPSLFAPYVFCTAGFLSGWFGLFYRPFLLKTKGMLRCLKNQGLYNDLQQRRQDLVERINKF